MSEALPVVYLARHGETAWSHSGQHTGRTDLPLTERGERQARIVGERLRGLAFAKVLTSPSQRAVRTAEILAERPHWQLFRDGCPGGEFSEQVAARADRVVERVRAVNGNVLMFSSAHILRVLAARW